MRYLHNYKGTTLPLWADRVKNWLLSFPLAFFSPSLHPEGWCTTMVGWVGGWVADAGGGGWGYISATRRRHPALWEPINIQRAEQCRSNRRSKWLPSAWCPSSQDHFLQNMNWDVHARARTLAPGQNAARGTLCDINLHSAEMCEAGRLRGGQWCRLRQGGHLGSMMLSYVPAGGPGEASTYEMVVNLH